MRICNDIKGIERNANPKQNVIYGCGNSGSKAGMDPSTSILALCGAFGASHEKINNLNLSVSQKGELTSLGCSLDCAA